MTYLCLAWHSQQALCLSETVMTSHTKEKMDCLRFDSHLDMIYSDSACCCSAQCYSGCSRAYMN